jgi:hypothetical protein
MPQWRKTDDTANLRLRVEPELLAKLEKAREKNGRTLSGEIVHRVEASFARDQTRQSALQYAATIVEVMADTITPDVTPEKAQEHLRKVIDGLKRIAVLLQQDQQKG